MSNRRAVFKSYAVHGDQLRKTIDFRTSWQRPLGEGPFITPDQNFGINLDGHLTINWGDAFQAAQTIQKQDGTTAVVLTLSNNDGKASRKFLWDSPVTLPTAQQFVGHALEAIAHPNGVNVFDAKEITHLPQALHGATVIDAFKFNEIGNRFPGIVVEMQQRQTDIIAERQAAFKDRFGYDAA